MLFKSTNIQTHVGLGTPRALNQNPAHTTAMLTNGAFYGRSYRDGAKLFHCPSLGLYAAPITGHVERNANTDYIYLTPMFGYTAVNCLRRNANSSKDFVTGVHPTKLHLTDWGSVPYSFQYDGSDNNAGSTDTGLCDSLALKGQYWQSGSSASIGYCSFYGLGQLCIGAGVTGFNTDKDCGPATIGNSGEATIKAQQYASAKNVVWISALLPPTKTYTPYNDEA